MKKIALVLVSASLVFTAGLASADNTNLVGVNAGSQSSSGASAYGGNPQAGAGVDFNYAPTSNYQAQKYHAGNGQNALQIPGSNLNNFYPHTKTLGGNSSFLSDFMSTNCDKRYSVSPDEIDNIDSVVITETENFTFTSTLYADARTSGYLMPDPNTTTGMTGGVISNIAKELPLMDPSDRFGCVAEIVAVSKFGNATPNALAAAAKDFAASKYGNYGPLTFIKDPRSFTVLDGQHSAHEGTSISGGIGGSPGTMFSSLAAGWVGTDTQVTQQDPSAAVLHVVLRYGPKHPMYKVGHDLIAAVKADIKSQKDGVKAQAQADRDARLQAAVDEMLIKKQAEKIVKQSTLN
ncbi:MAG: hypothetical protein RLZZ230_370 [Candidatus Parcubacteria bacterium]|jgi:hypothetical protein